MFVFDFVMGIIDFVKNLDKENMFFFIISSIVSAIISIIISKYYYNKSNRDAFVSDIILPIHNSLDKGLMYTIKDVRALYSYRYKNNNEEKLIYNLFIKCEAAKDNNLYKAFAEAVLEYFYSKTGIERTHKQYIDELGEFIDEQNYDYEPLIPLQKIVGDYWNPEYIETREFDVSQILAEYYWQITENSNNDIKFFDDKNLVDMFEESRQYKNYSKCQDELQKAKQDFMDYVKKMV